VNVHDDTFDRVLHFQFYQDTRAERPAHCGLPRGSARLTRSDSQQNQPQAYQRLEVDLELVDSIL